MTNLEVNPTTDEETSDSRVAAALPLPPIEEMFSFRMAVLSPDCSDIENHLASNENKITEIKRELKALDSLERELNECFDFVYPYSVTPRPKLHIFLQSLNRALNVANTQTGLVGRGGSSKSIVTKAFLISGVGGAFLGEISGLGLGGPAQFEASFGVAAISSMFSVIAQGFLMFRDDMHAQVFYPYFRKDYLDSDDHRNAATLFPSVVVGFPLQLLKTVTFDAFKWFKNRNNKDNGELSTAKKYLDRNSYSQTSACAYIREFRGSLSELFGKKYEYNRSIDRHKKECAKLKEQLAEIKEFPTHLESELDLYCKRIEEELINKHLRPQIRKLREAPEEEISTDLESVAANTRQGTIEELLAEVGSHRALLAKLINLSAFSEHFEQFKVRQLDSRRYCGGTDYPDLKERYVKYCSDIFTSIENLDRK